MKEKQAGQAMIILLLVSSIALIFLMHTVVLNLESIGLGNEYLTGLNLLTQAEAYLENAALRSLRDPTYSGETIVNTNLTCTSVVIETPMGKEITSACQKGSRSRKVGLDVTFDQGVYLFSLIEEKE